jgi:precorrin-3B methylase
LEIIKEFRLSHTPVGIVKAATRENELVKVNNLSAIDLDEIDMETTLIIGNNSTFTWQGFLITPRGYLI